MGIIANQAKRNLVFIGLGFLAGAINTLLVLPHAFEFFPEGWGTLRLIIATFMILSQIFSFGATNIIIRFLNRQREQPGGVLRYVFWIVLAGIGLMSASLIIGGEAMTKLIFKEEAVLIEGKLHLIGILAGSYILFLMFQGYVNAILKSSFHQFLNETFLKGYYLGIASLFLFGILSFDQLLIGFVGGYILATLILIIYSVAHGYTLRHGDEVLPKREMMVYGAYSVLDKGATTIVNQLDVLMVGLLMTVSNVGLYAFAAYIGTLVQMPQRAILAVANPIASKALSENDHQTLADVYNKSCRDQLILGGIIFVAVWVSIDELMSLMPGEFGNGKWVVLFIGLSKLTYMASGVSGGILVYSRYFRTNLWLNLSLIGLTIGTNYLFISPQFLGLGIEGAAIATALTFLIYNALKMIFINEKFGINPANRKFCLIALLIAAAALIHMIKIEASPYLIIPLKSGISIIILGVLIYLMKLSPDINTQVNNFLKKG